MTSPEVSPCSPESAYRPETPPCRPELVSGPHFFLRYPVLVILGHYGSGKTNLALGLAHKLSAQGRKPLIVDLDIVNPYFRTTDYAELATELGIKVVGPVFGNSNLDAPSLPPGVDALIKQATLESPVILDVGGDPDGARALVRYVPALTEVSNKLVMMVVNTRRPETRSLEDNLAMLDELSTLSGLPIDAIIGNTHLAEFTTVETVEQSLPLLEELSQTSELPLVAVTFPSHLPVPPKREAPYLSLERLVKTNWQ